MIRRFTDETLALAEEMAGDLTLADDWSDCPCCRLRTVCKGICHVCDWGCWQA